MKQDVIRSYENYREEDRLTTNNARRIEFLTTVRILEEWLPEGQRILDCAAGTGVYAFYLADRGHRVTATDLTPRHIEVIREQLKGKPYNMDTRVMDATDLRAFADESFDVVLNMGPFYHLVETEERERCLSECVRVLRPGGLLVTAYIPRFYVFQYVALRDPAYLDANLSRQLVQTGAIRSGDRHCFWTDNYFATCEEMEALYASQGLCVVDHFAQDGAAPHFSDVVDGWTQAQFEVWCEHHYRVCRERSLLGASNHAVVIGRKRSAKEG